MVDMETTTNREGIMSRETFNQQLIQGLWSIRHKRPETREWLRQCIRIERKRRS